MYSDFVYGGGVFQDLSGNEKQRVLAGIGAAMQSVADGAEHFLDITRRHADLYKTIYPESWEEQIARFVYNETKPWGCGKFCPYAGSCNNDTNMLVTALKNKSK